MSYDFIVGEIGIFAIRDASHAVLGDFCGYVVACVVDYVIYFVEAEFL